MDDSNKTLGEIKASYEDNVDYLEKRVKDFPFQSIVHAQMFMGTCLNEAMTSLGILVSKDMRPEFVDRRLKVQGVTVEQRTYDAEEDPDEVKKNGLYISKKGEIVFFISEPMVYKPHEFAIDNSPRYVVRTNVVLPGGKGVIG